MMKVILIIQPHILLVNVVPHERNTGRGSSEHPVHLQGATSPASQPVGGGQLVTAGELNFNNGVQAEETDNLKA